MHISEGILSAPVLATGAALTVAGCAVDGIIGLLLGWAAIPAILVALTLQALLF